MTSLLAVVSAIIAAIAVTLSAWTILLNSRVNRAKFLYDLHRDFFVSPTYKTMRECIDSPSDSDNVREAVLKEGEEFTDFLNFFELVAYYQRYRLLTPHDVDALLGYYLDRMDRHIKVVNYVRAQQTSFEHLAWLIEKRRTSSHA